MCGASPFGIAWTLVPIVLALCPACRPKAPDLATCTRIELHYTRGALNHFFPSSSIRNTILSADEREYVQSCDSWTVTDQDLIKTFARDLSQGVYRRKERGFTPGGVGIVGYCGSERVASFTAYPKCIITEDKKEFEYPLGSPDLKILEPPRVGVLRLRWECALHLSKLFIEGLKQGRASFLYPDPNQWCDVIVEALRSRYFTYVGWGDKKKRSYSDEDIAKLFACPGTRGSADARNSDTESRAPARADEPVRPSTSNYALNPNCTRDSPGDTVFFFETESSWNRHGGPELFTFKNHDPCGGLVFLKDGSVKFIRTEEELKQLRWK